MSLLMMAVYINLDIIDPIPEIFRLKSNYPNPFNPTTIIPLDIPEESFVKVSIFNILGQEVTKLFSGELSVGFYDHLSWDGKMGNGQKAPSGIYFILVEGAQFHTWQKVTLIR